MPKPDIGRESRYLPTPAAFHAPLGKFPSEYCHKVWCEKKTRMAWLPGGEKSLRTCLLISTDYTNVTDRQTDGHRMHDGIGRAYAQHRTAKMNMRKRR